MAILGMRPVNREKLYRVYAEELLRLKNGKFASFEDVYGDLMKESGVDPAWAANISPEAARFMEECEKRFLAANYRYLERGVEHAWKDILEGDYDCAPDTAVLFFTHRVSFATGWEWKRIPRRPWMPSRLPRRRIAALPAWNTAWLLWTAATVKRTM